MSGFYIYYRPYSSSHGAVEYRRRTAPAAGTRRPNYMLLSGLVPDTTYSIRMTAYNQFGTSEFSNTVVQKTLALAGQLPASLQSVSK